MSVHEKDLVEVQFKTFALQGNLHIPTNAQGIVLFAHGSGSSRKSPRNMFVAEQLQKASLATLLIDLLTKEEEESDAYTGHLRFNIEFLAKRLEGITEWLMHQMEIKKLNLGYFGASTGAAAALVASTKCPQVKAIVSRGGRPDLAKQALSHVKAPTLLIVGERDEEVITLNQQAFALLKCEKKLMIVPKATHLFEEKGTLEEVALLAKGWFLQHLAKEQNP